MNNEILEILNELKPKEDFSADGSFIEEGLFDSFDIISLINMLEEKYKIIVDGLDIVPENFENVEAIINLVNKSQKV